jgi:hypothetical protein
MYGHSALYCRSKSVHVLKGEASVSVKYSLAHIAFKTLYVPAGKSGVRILIKVRHHQNLLLNAYRGNFQGTKLSGREFQHLPISSVEVENAPPECRHGVHRDKFLLLPLYCTIALSP